MFLMKLYDQYPFIFVLIISKETNFTIAMLLHLRINVSAAHSVFPHFKIIDTASQWARSKGLQLVIKTLIHWITRR